VIDHYAGQYWRPQWDKDGNLLKIFVGHVVGGEAIQRGPETLAVDWFSLNALPSRLVPDTQMHIANTLDNLNSGASPFQKTTIIPRYRLYVTRVLLWLRDLRNRWLRKTI